MPKGKAIHAIVDNYATHKHPKVKEWLARHPRWTFHFTPTSSSWLNAVEGFFAKLTKRRLKRGVFGSVVELQVAINRFLAETNTNPRPFLWTKDPHKILAAVKIGHQVLDLSTSGTAVEIARNTRYLQAAFAALAARGAAMTSMVCPAKSTNSRSPAMCTWRSVGFSRLVPLAIQIAEP